MMLHRLPIFSTTVARLLFFGGRYVSLLLVARLLGSDATGFLLAIAIVEVLRMIFDYGLENSVLARSHQKPNDAGYAFARGKGRVRLFATVAGQLVASLTIGTLSVLKGTSLALPLVASLQFSCLMGFGYFQAHLQTGRAGGMAALVLPLAFAAVMQAALLWFAYRGVSSLLFLSTFCFEALALVACAVMARRFQDEPFDVLADAPAASALPGTSWSVLAHIAPLGNVALVGIAYNRLDAFAVSLVASGALLTQYLLYQRLASAPLMFFSTIASSSISTLSEHQSNPAALQAKIVRYRQLAYSVAVVSAIVLAAASPLVAQFFALPETDHGLLAAQALILALQISNGFHASILIASHKVAVLWRMSRRNALVALFVLPGAIWLWGGIGIAIGLFLVEAFCAAQHAWEFRRKELGGENLHA
ncbi:hypothetical protein [Janthinobacterium sp. HLX7-2]|uniref:hypothetical protein n=1 Tax=Janthinobacterium sp. HLX7-2 TaxID=1259331 RepID=UPI003F27722E